MGKIIIDGLKIFAYHGVNEEEKENGQFFIVDLIAELDLSKAGLTDGIGDTVSYAAIIKSVRRLMTEEKNDLLERVVYRLAQGLFKEYPAIDSLSITLKKPDAPIKADFRFVAVKEVCQRGRFSVTQNVSERNVPADTKTVLLGIGTNLGDRAANLRAAVDSLALLPKTRVAAVSPTYETEPVGYLDQPDFLNLVVKIETELSPSAVLGACLGIEAALGRVRSFRNAPRVIDIDVLLYEGYQSDTGELTLPHPRMAERAFVLVPLLDLYPDGNALGFNAAEALKRVGEDGVRRYAES